MKKQQIAASTAALLVAAVARVSFAQTATLPTYEPFNYAPGDLDGKGAWGTKVSSGVSVDASNTLSHPNLPTVGGSVTEDATASGAEKMWITPTPTSATGQTVYYSFLLQVTDISNLNTGTGTYFAGFNNVHTSTGLSVGSSAVRLVNLGSNQYGFGLAKDLANAFRRDRGLDQRIQSILHRLTSGGWEIHSCFRINQQRSVRSVD